MNRFPRGAAAPAAEQLSLPEGAKEIAMLRKLLGRGRWMLPLLFLRHLVAARAGADCYDYSQSVHWSGSLNIPLPADGTVGSPALAGDVVYGSWRLVFPQSGGGLWGVDVSDPTAPRALFMVNVAANAGDVAASPGHVYLAGGSTVRIFDVSVPAQPVQVGSFGTPGQVGDLWLAGSLLYVTNPTAVLIMDVSNPASPALVGSVSGLGTVYTVAA